MSSKISVIMSIYNETEEQIKSSIESILNQTYENFEFIIILDNPNYKYKNVIESYKDSRIKFIINDENIGLAKSLNKALKLARCKYIARMDADDISLPNRFEEQIKYLQDNNLDLCGAGIEYFDEDKSYEKIVYPINYNDIKEALKYFNCVPHPTWFGKKEVFDKNNGYQEEFIVAQDYDFLVRAIINGAKIGNINKILLKYRLSKEGISRKKIGLQELFGDFIKYNYKKGICIDHNIFDKFYNSKKIERTLKKYNNFYNLHKKRVKAKKNKNIIKYFYYLFISIIYVNLFIKTVRYKYLRKKYLKVVN